MNDLVLPHAHFDRIPLNTREASPRARIMVQSPHVESSPIDILIDDLWVASINNLMPLEHQHRGPQLDLSSRAFSLDKVHPRIIEQLLRSSKTKFHVRVFDQTRTGDPSSIVPRTALEAKKFIPAFTDMNSGEFVGYFEGLLGSALSGWALNRFNPAAPVSIDIYKDFVYLGTWPCERYRPDVSRFFESSSTSGFQIDLRDLGLQADNIGAITHFDIRVAGTYYFLRELEQKERSFPKPIVKSATNIDHAGTIIATHHLRQAPRNTKQGLALYAIHTQLPSLSRVHVAVMRELQRQGFHVVLINSFEENQELLGAQLDGLADSFVVRRNHGRDFGSWVSYVMTNFEFVKSFNHILFVNDSLLGPILPLDKVCKQWLRTDAGLWALTDSYQQAYHLQSSFFGIRKDSWESETFRDFFSEYQYPNEKRLVIEQGEIALSAAAINADLQVAAMCPYGNVARFWLHAYSKNIQHYPEVPEAAYPLLPDKAIPRGVSDRVRAWYAHLAADIRAQVPKNPQHYFWNTLIKEFGYPFIKKELVVLNPEAVPNLDLVCETVGMEYWKLLSECIHDALVLTPGKAPPINLTQ